MDVRADCRERRKTAWFPGKQRTQPPVLCNSLRGSETTWVSGPAFFSISMVGHCGRLDRNEIIDCET